LANLTSLKGASLLSVAAIVLCAITAVAQSAKDTPSAKDSCGPAPVIPLTTGGETGDRRDVSQFSGETGDRRDVSQFSEKVDVENQ
jgi:hypothetical protein